LTRQGHTDEIRSHTKTLTLPFLCFIEPSKPHIRKFFRKIDTTEAVGNLAIALEQAISKVPGVSRLKWWSEHEQ